MRPTFELSEETKIIKAILEGAQEGEVISYSRLTAAVGKDVQEHCRGNIFTARKHLLRDLGYVFRAAANVGLERLNNDQKVDAGRESVKRASRMAFRGEKVMQTIDWEILTRDQIREATSSRMVLAVQRISARKTNLERLRQIADGKSGACLPPADQVMKKMLDAVTGKKPDAQ